MYSQQKFKIGYAGIQDFSNLVEAKSPSSFVRSIFHSTKDFEFIIQCLQRSRVLVVFKYFHFLNDRDACFLAVI